MKYLKYLIISLLIVLPQVVKPQPINQIDWPSFMHKHDLVWDEIPLQWNEGAFVGNGMIGMMIYVDKKSNSIVFHIGRSDVTEHRKAPDKKSSIGVIGARGFTDFTRFDVGKMNLKTTGKILSGTIRQDLWNAQITAHFITDSGTIDLKCFTPYNHNVHIVEVKSTEKTSDNRTSYEWKFKPGRAYPPRFVTAKSDTTNYIKNPPPMLSSKDGYSYCEQTLNAGGDYATVWKEKVGSKANESVFYMAIANEIPEVHQSVNKGKEYIDEVINKPLEELKSTNADWWHNFYKKSFLSIPDAKMESFYWIQLYKMATCSRPESPAVDLFGPYFRISSWPYHWWNLNIQLTYWPVYASNHLELGENFISIVDENFKALLSRFKEKSLGDFAWALHNYWWQYTYSGDWQALKEKWMPKAVEVANVYNTKLIKNSDGKLEIMPLGSPEYKEFTLFPNTNYNLALLRWLLNSLIEVNNKTKLHHPDAAKWEQTLKDLIPYPVNENGLMIGSNQGVEMSHRHFSHLLALYPLYQLNPDNKADKDLVVKSVKHWHQIDNGKALQGYSFTGASLLYTSLGMGNEALACMHQFLGDSLHKSRILTNTFYVEGGGKNPVIETPLSGAAGVIDFSLQSWGNKIRVFPALPDSWKDVTFDQLRAQGGFLVSAARKNGVTQWIQIKSLAGEPCVVKVPDWDNAVVAGEKKRAIKKISTGEFSISLKKGEEVLLMQKGVVVVPVISVVNTQLKDQNAYGIKKGQQLTNDQFYPE